MLCPCDSKLNFQQCCGPLIQGEKLATTAEQLMRSRYSAYVQQEQDYLLKTWHPAHRPKSLDFEDNEKWLGLKVKKVVNGREVDSTGTVEFVARFRVGGGRAQRIHEVSQFLKLDGQWYYLEGTFK